MECGDASGTGLLDVRRRSWHSGLLHALDPDRDLAACLPPLVAAGQPMGTLREAAAAALGLPAGVKVAPGGGDNMMAAIGTGNVAPGCLTVSLGTSGTLYTHSVEPVIDESGVLAAFCSSTGGWLPLLCTMNCTVATELTRNLLDIPLDELDRRVAGVPAGSAGVVTVPFFNGERSPDLPAGKGCVLGLDPDNYHPDNLLRSAMESAVYALRSGLDTFRRLGCAIDSVRLTGGGAGSASWRQLVADVFDLPVSVQQIDEGAALGAALQAGWIDQAGERRARDLAGFVEGHLSIDRQRSCQPERDSVDQYTQYFQDYRRHVETVTPLYSAKIERQSI